MSCSLPRNNILVNKFALVSCVQKPWSVRVREELERHLFQGLRNKSGENFIGSQHTQKRGRPNPMDRERPPHIHRALTLLTAVIFPSSISSPANKGAELGAGEEDRNLPNVPKDRNEVVDGVGVRELGWRQRRLHHIEERRERGKMLAREGDEIVHQTVCALDEFTTKPLHKDVLRTIEVLGKVSGRVFRRPREVREEEAGRGGIAVNQRGRRGRGRGYRVIIDFASKEEVERVRHLRNKASLSASPLDTKKFNLAHPR